MRACSGGRSARNLRGDAHKQRNWLEARGPRSVTSAVAPLFWPETAECRPPERLAMEVTQYEVLYSGSYGCGAGLLRVWTCISSSSSTTEPTETTPGQSRMLVRKDFVAWMFVLFTWTA